MELKNKSIYSILIFINVMFLINIARQCLNIKDIEVILITLLYLFGIFIYWVYEYLFQKKIHKILFVIFILSSAFAFFYFNSYFIIKDIRRLNYLIDSNRNTYFYQYKYIIIIFLPIIVGIIIWVTDKISNKIILLITLSIITVLWFNNYTDFVKKNLFYFIFVSLFTYIINAYVTENIKSSQNNIKVNIGKKGFVALTLLICFIFSITANILPGGFNGKNFTQWKSNINNKFGVSNNENTDNSEEVFDLVQVGYSTEDRRLGGPISIINEKLFEVKSDSSYYLRGSIKNYYNGYLWSKKENEYYKQDLSNFVYKNMSNKYSINKKKLEIYHYKEFKSKTVFSPNLTYDVSLKNGEIYYDEMNNIFNDKIITKPYIVDFYEIKDDNSYVLDNLINFNEPKFKKYFEYKIDNNSNKNLYEQYLQVPNNISPKIYELVEDIIGDCKTNLQKVEKIKQYIEANYKYSLDVSEIPEDEEFLQYFLFKEKKGYCTYFATAVTIMCRIAGIPARYVEGFKMPYFKEIDGKYIVSTENAHAWSEVLAIKDDNIWAIVDISPTLAENLDDIDNDEFDEMMLTPNRHIRDVDSDLEDLNINKSNNEKFKLFIILISIVCGILLYYVMNRLYFYRIKTNIIQDDSSIPIYNYYLKRLKRINIDKLECDGDSEFVQGLEDNILRKQMTELVSAVYEEFYGHEKNCKVDKQRYYSFIEEYIKKSKGKFKYYIDRLIFWS